MRDNHLSGKSSPRLISSPLSNKEQAILGSVQRLKQVLDEENRLLEGGKSADHQPFIDRKNQILRELLTFQSMGSDFVDIPEIRNALEEVRPLVDKNHGLLLAHTAALSDIAGLLRSAAAQEESDGTYSRYGDAP
jgi:hypothetical protein